LALLIEQEGDASPADVFISQSPGALGFLAGDGRLRQLDPELLATVDAGFRASDDTWVGLTGRVRVVVYNSELVDPADLPDSVLDLADPAYAGRVGVAPTNPSFQDFVTAMRNELGDEATLEWLEGMAANDSPNYQKNSPIVEAVGRGEIDMGLVNHYYNLRALEADPSLPSVNHFLPADDLGSVVIITGGAVLDTSDAPSESEQLLAYLLGDEAQTTFVTETQEYALSSTAPVSGPDGVPTLDALTVDTIDFGLLGEGLEGTVEMIRASGIER
jgi:iron(III) transport system substrate-binding protein